MMRIGIYGGTFNPIHNGHIHVVSEFCNRIRLDRLLIIPTYLPPHKGDEQLASPMDRLQMCRLAVQSCGKILEVSDTEIKRGGKSYTVDTLTELENDNPGAELILLMGEDMFATLEKWRMAEQIFQKAEICVAPRSSEGLERLEELRQKFIKNFHAKIRFEQIPYKNISSTQIRRRVKSGEGISDLVPTKVERYIVDNGIYNQGITLAECEAAIRPLLSAPRFHHSRCVSRAAEELAGRYGADPSKAAIAGMLHDIMKDTPWDAQLKILSRFDIILSSTEKKLPKLLHAITGAAYIKNCLNIDDEEILNAVRWHTCGRAGMTLLDKVVYIADFISEDRDYTGVDLIRLAAKQSLELAIYEGISFTIGTLMSEKKYIDPHMLEAYNDILEQI